MQVYDLKDRLLVYWSDFLVDGRISRDESKSCWSCGGTGYVRGTECYRCDSSGWYSSRVLYEVRYRFPGDGREYCFHTYTRPSSVSNTPGADLPTYGHRFTDEERRSLPFGFHDLLGIVRHEAKLLEQAAEQRRRDALQERWSAYRLPPLTPRASLATVEQCLGLVAELTAPT